MALEEKDLEAIGEIVEQKLDSRLQDFEIRFEKKFDQKLGATKQEIIALC